MLKRGKRSNERDWCKDRKPEDKKKYNVSRLKMDKMMKVKRLLNNLLGKPNEKRRYPVEHVLISDL